MGRAIKTGATTGLGTAIPKIGSATVDTVDAIGTAVAWCEGSALITCGDVIATNAYNKAHKQYKGRLHKFRGNLAERFRPSIKIAEIMRNTRTRRGRRAERLGCDG